MSLNAIPKLRFDSKECLRGGKTDKKYTYFLSILSKVP